MAAHAARKLPLTPAIADREMRIIKSFEELVFQRHRDTSIEEVALVLRLLYSFQNIRIKTITTAEDIKQEQEQESWQSRQKD